CAYAEVFGDQDVHVLDVLPIPERLEDWVAQPEDEQVLDALFAEVMVDPVNLALVEELVHERVQLLRRFEILPERLLHHDPRPSRRRVEADGAEVLDGFVEGDGGEGEVKDAVAGKVA